MNIEEDTCMQAMNIKEGGEYRGTCMQAKNIKQSGEYRGRHLHAGDDYRGRR